MTAVFNAPVAAVGGKNALRVSLLRGSAGDAVGDFTGVFTGFFICGLSLDEKSLSDMRKVQIAVEFSGGPDFADFDASMVRRIEIDKIGILPIFEVKGDVLKETGLVVFDGEVVMSVAFFDQVGGDLALSQQGVGGNFFALNIDGVKERDGGLDFIGTFEGFVVYRQRAYFFWV
jgi:hypothetical protein